MAIVATKRGGRIRGVPGTANVRALSWENVDGIIQRFEQLKPYVGVASTLLKLEDENFGSGGTQRQLYAYVISAKRYCLFSLERGRPVIRKFSESGLGQLLDPLDADHDPAVLDPDSNSAESVATGRPWIRQFWEDTVALARGEALPNRPWLTRPALSQLTVSTPSLLADFEESNRNRPYDEQVKAFNFMLIANDAAIGPDRKVLVAPYERDPARWLRLPWRKRSDGTARRISVRASAGGSRTVRVATYGTQFQLHRVHLEAKSLGPDGEPVRPLTAGLLLRRPVFALSVEHIGKEAKNLELVAAGMAGPDGAYTVFEDAWQLARQVLATVPIEQAIAFTGRMRSATMELRAGRSDSSRSHRAEMVMAIATWCRDELALLGVTEAFSDFEALAAWRGPRSQTS